MRISVLSEACLSLCTSAAGIPGVTTQPVHSFGDTNLTKNTFEMFVSLSSALVTAILDRYIKLFLSFMSSFLFSYFLSYLHFLFLFYLLLT